MAGTKEGAAKTIITVKQRHGDNFYGKIGSKGGKLSRNGGFASEKIGPDGLTGRQRASVEGRIGGSISKRTSKHVNV